MHRNIFTALQLLALLGHANGLAQNSVSTVWSKPLPSTDATVGKESTALDVLRELNKASILSASVVKPGTAVVTGGNSGIGAASVETMAVSGMKVVLCSRDADDGETIRASLPAWCRDNVRVQKLDLSDLDAVRDAAEEILATDGAVDVLLNNAGVMAPPKRESTAQGFELQFGVNHIGHHLLTRFLLPGMSSDGRVVTVASEAHRTASLDFSDMNYDSKSYSPWGAYGQSKLANILFAKELNDRFVAMDGCEMKSVSLHPGVIGTNLWRYSTPSFIRSALTSLISDKTVEQGAATSVYACLVASSQFSGGEYLSDCAVAEPTNYAKDSNGVNRKKLWEETEAMIANAGFDLPGMLL
mmetsp:Transcript_35196/g.105125  ORF Transcript_35196/g.105125 Transcript_35196/m.105125 type:complete len:357 (-) Transcript_35196:238-1308(-)